MKQLALSYYQDIYLVIIAFFIFLTAFIYIFISTYSKSRIKLYRELSMLPLEEDVNGNE